MMRQAITLLCVMAAAAAGLSGCATSSQATGAALADARACRGPETRRDPEKAVRFFQGMAVTADGGPVPGVKVVATDANQSDRVYVTTTDASGKFRLDGIPIGSYVLKTCLAGFDTLEVPVTVSPNAPVEGLVLGLRLSK